MLTAEKKLDAMRKFISVIENPVSKEFAMLDTQVPYDEAIVCLDNYSRVIPPLLGSAFTKSVSFSGPAILDWMNNLNTCGNYDEIRIEFGIYDNKMVKSHRLSTNHVGRLTIFIAAYYQNARATTTADPRVLLPLYNIGHLDPP